MNPSFFPRLINTPFDDPGIFIPFLFEKRAIVFDLGDMASLSSRDILKVSHIFVTHTHMDHFIGFDRLLRLFLGRKKELFLFGPEGLLKNVEGKLAGYSWNLVEHYSNQFILHVNEIDSDKQTSIKYVCQNRFLPIGEVKKLPYNGTLIDEPAMSVSSVILDHSIPCLGLTIKERFHVNIKKDAVLELGLDLGPWLKDFKLALFSNQEQSSEFIVRCGKENSEKKRFALGDLAQKIAIIAPGQKITYIADVGFSSSNAKKIIAFAKDADQFFVESVFLDKDRELAEKKHHLTARQAGTLAGLARAKHFILFHFSPRYTGQAHLLQQEAMDAYKEAVLGNSEQPF